MTTTRVLRAYRDDRGNEIIYDGHPRTDFISVKFAGSNNVLRVADNAKIVSLSVDFAGDGGEVIILPTSQRRTGLRLSLRVGHQSGIEIGENVGTTKRAFISAVEGASVRIGNDCMIATGVEIRTDDAHPIYDVRSGTRVNPSESIDIGDHVWLAKNSVIMGGVTIGTGSVIGFGSIVTRSVPNNCIAVGAPARVVRRHVAWERPMLRDRLPAHDEPLPGEAHKEFWRITEETAPHPTRKAEPPRRFFRLWPRAAKRVYN